MLLLLLPLLLLLLLLGLDWTRSFVTDTVGGFVLWLWLALDGRLVSFFGSSSTKFSFFYERHERVGTVWYCFEVVLLLLGGTC